MEGHCSTGQSPQWAIVPMEEEEEGGGGGGHIHSLIVRVSRNQTSITLWRIGLFVVRELRFWG